MSACISEHGEFGEHDLDEYFRFRAGAERMRIESRPRQSGKVYEAALILASRCGLPVDVISRLITAGWTYSERLGSPHRWESPVNAFEKVEDCGYEREMRDGS